MVSLKSILAAAVAVGLSVAAPVEVESSVTCGQTVYSSVEVIEAVQAGCYNLQTGRKPGGYPHEYKNYEKFDFFPVPSPWFEFPVLRSGIYKGGMPGPDRVIFNNGCQHAGTITHTGAKGSAFVGCSDTQKRPSPE